MFEVKDCSIEPDKKIMALRSLLFLAQGIIGLYGFIVTGSWPLFVFWLAVILLFLTIPRSLICARCEDYGKKCYSMYLGFYTSKLFKPSDKEIPKTGLALEAFCLITIPLLPLFPLYSIPVLFGIYIVLSAISFALQFFHACRYCAVCSSDSWKKICPAHMAAKRIWSEEVNNIRKK